MPVPWWKSSTNNSIASLRAVLPAHLPVAYWLIAGLPASLQQLIAAPALERSYCQDRIAKASLPFATEYFERWACALKNREFHGQYGCALCMQIFNLQGILPQLFVSSGELFLRLALRQQRSDQSYYKNNPKPNINVSAIRCIRTDGDRQGCARWCFARSAPGEPETAKLSHSPNAPVV